MKVVKLNGVRPDQWLAVQNHCYVGRRVSLRSGKYAGQVWPTSPLANKFRPGRDVDPIGQYRKWLEEQLRDESSAAYQAFQSLTADLVLGCWCVNADEDEIAEVGSERCHAEVIWNVWRKRKKVNSL